MSSLRFNHVFLILMGAAFVSAFILPPTLTDSTRLAGAGIFNPLSAPVHRLALAVDQKLSPQQRPPPGDAQTLSDENDRLRQEVVRLQGQLDEMRKLEGEHAKLGDLRSLCVRVPVAGEDAGGRDALILSLPSGGKMAQDDPVLYPGGLAGKLEAAHGAARVRLITDRGFVVTGAFVRTSPEMTKLAAPPAVVEGRGQGQLAVANMKMSDCVVSGLMVGDWVILDDPRWPRAAGLRLGRITYVGAMKTAPLFADIRLATDTDLTRLSDVWVLAGGGGDQ